MKKILTYLPPNSQLTPPPQRVRNEKIDEFGSFWELFSVSVGVLSKILDFDIFVRYESVNLNDYRHFQVFCIHMSLIEHQCTTACQYQ